MWIAFILKVGQNDVDVLFIYFSLRFILNNHYTLSVNFPPWETKHRFTHRLPRQSDSKKQLPFLSFQPEISETDATLFSSAMLVCYLAARETSVEFISCVCWGNTEWLSSLKEVLQQYNTCLTPAPLEKKEKERKIPNFFDGFFIRWEIFTICFTSAKHKTSQTSSSRYGWSTLTKPKKLLSSTWYFLH